MAESQRFERWEFVDGEHLPSHPRPGTHDDGDGDEERGVVVEHKALQQETHFKSCSSSRRRAAAAERASVLGLRRGAQGDCTGSGGEAEARQGCRDEAAASTHSCQDRSHQGAREEDQRHTE